MQAALEEGGAAEMALVERFRAGDAADAPASRRRRSTGIARGSSRMWGRECPPQAYAGLADLYLDTSRLPRALRGARRGLHRLAGDGDEGLRRAAAPSC